MIFVVIMIAGSVILNLVERQLQVQLRPLRVSSRSTLIVSYVLYLALRSLCSNLEIAHRQHIFDSLKFLLQIVNFAL